jgi:hypothetical protein
LTYLSRRKFLRSLWIASLGLAAACSPDAVQVPPAAAQPSATPPADTPVPQSPTPAVFPVLEEGERALKGVLGVDMVARLLGENAINDTPKLWEVNGADLGSMFDKDGKLFMVFGDSFGCCIPGTGGPGNATDWRYNLMAVISDRDPSDGLTFEAMISDRAGHARQLLPRGKFDKTIIPTYGVAVGSRMFLHYMAVLAWGNPGEWVLNESGWAYSDDDGQNWTKDPAAKWDGKSNFGQTALVKNEEYLYVFGIPGGRLGGAKLGRVLQQDVLNMSAYHSYAGSQDGSPQWVEDENSAALVVPAPVGELSVMWNEYLGRWIMTYLHSDTGGLVIREAKEMWGPWGPALPLVSAFAYPGLYGAYMHPWFVENKGETIYFTMSRWGTYTVYLMKAQLEKA